MKPSANYKLLAFLGMCTGAGTGQKTGPKKPRSGTFCTAVPDVGYTTTADFLIGQGQGYSYYLELYLQDLCKGGPVGRYDGNPGGRVCIETQGATSFKVITKRGVKAARDDKVNLIAPPPEAAEIEISSLGERGITATTALERRAHYTLGLLQFGVSSTAAWIYAGAGKCPLTANEDDVNKTQCGLAATFSVLSLFFTFYQAQGLYRHGAPDARRIKGRALGLTHLDDILGLPKQNTSLIDGMSISVNTLEPYIDEIGSAWHHYSWHGQDIESGQVFQATVRLHPDGRSQAVSRVEDESESGIDKRDNTNAYYSWTDNNKSNFKNAKHGKSAVKKAAAEVWNYGKKNDVAEHCVDFTDYGANPTKYIDYGSFAIVSGDYVDQSGFCRR